MAFIYAYFFSDFLRFDMSLLLLTGSCGGYLISIAYCHFFNIYSGQIRTLVAMATYIFHRLIMGKVEINSFFCLNRDIWN